MGLLGPVTLTGNHVRLEPMRPVHAAALLEAGRSTEIWAWMPARPLTAQTMDRWLEKALQAEAQGREYPFVVVRLEDDRVIGSSRYLDVQEEDRTVEIGWTWYSPDAWGSVVNPEAKYLLMRHAFDDWRAIRVARGATGRDLLVKFDGCYHGHADSLLVKAGSGGATFGIPDSRGVPAALGYGLSAPRLSAPVAPGSRRRAACGGGSGWGHRDSSLARRAE